MLLVPFVEAAGGLVHRYTFCLSSCTWTAGEPSAARDQASSQYMGCLAVLTPVSSHSFSFPSVSCNSPISYTHSIPHTPLTLVLSFHTSFFFFLWERKELAEICSFFQKDMSSDQHSIKCHWGHTFPGCRIFALFQLSAHLSQVIKSRTVT